MAIRFRCSACSQPIEVDDEWAAKTVACPYCRKAITAPAESTLGDVRQIPVATPLALGSSPMAVGETLSYPSTTVEPHPNRIAVVAAVLAGCMIGLLVMVSMIARAHLLELEELRKMTTSAANWNDLVRDSTEYWRSQGGFPGWMLALMWLDIALVLTWIVTLVCGIIGVRRPRRRALAAAALIVSGLIPLVFCYGGLVSGA